MKSSFVTRPISSTLLWDFFILVVRFLLGATFINYGYGKLTEGQFGISDTELATPLKDLSLFKLSWYLFDHQPFKAFIGVSQIVCGLLLIIHRTVLLGAFLFLPIVSTILIIDLSFMPEQLATGFAWRLSLYILLDFLILWHYKTQMKIIWRAVWQDVHTRFPFSVWAYLLVPVFAFGLEFMLVLPRLLVEACARLFGR